MIHFDLAPEVLLLEGEALPAAVMIQDSVEKHSAQQSGKSGSCAEQYGFVDSRWQIASVLV